MGDDYVLDAWCLLALLQAEEPAASRVKQLLEAAGNQRTRLSMSMVNLGEVYYRVGRVKGRDKAEKTLESIRRLPLTFLSATDERVLSAAEFKMDHAISYADAFAAATAKERKAILVTGDPELMRLEADVQIEKLHRHRH
ncbi:MAG: type II toxin-antitoxin system VapC family toxin [Chloroflexota bacterium]|nr:MAG: type II toxin-antitoxin system VapC family toxin [Chloroflexota bacterium]